MGKQPGIGDRHSGVTSQQRGARSPVSRGPLFEVEIATGNRSNDTSSGRGGRGRSDQTLSPLARERRVRARRRRRLLTAVGLTVGAALFIWMSAVLWEPALFGHAVARVNGKAITSEEVDKEIRLSRALSTAATGKEQSPAPPSMLEELILRELEVQAAQRANFQVTTQDIDAEVTSVTRAAGSTPEKVEASLLAYGLTANDLRDSLAKVALVEQFMQQNVASGVTDPKVRAAKINQWQADLVQGAKVQRFRDPMSGIAPRVGTEAPDFSLRQVGGREVRLSALRGRAVIIYFWAPWCPACRAEVPVLEQAYEAQVSDRSNGNSNSYNRFEILAVATQSQPDNVASFIEEYGMTFPVLMDTQNEVTDRYFVGSIPTSFFIDKDGIVVAAQVGQMDIAALQKKLELAR